LRVLELVCLFMLVCRLENSYTGKAVFGKLMGS
jgi:hypothetical protein